MDTISSDENGKFVWKRRAHSPSLKTKAFYGWTKSGKLIQADILYQPPEKNGVLESIKRLFK